MTFSEKCNAVVAFVKSRAGKNSYTQASPKREQVESGWSDCSSQMWYAYKKVLGIQIGGNTAAQIVSGKGRDVDIANGAYPNEDNLQPGDLLYFRGTDKSRPFSVGHVEIYTKKNECFGHGSGVGPTKKNLKTHCKSRYDQGKGYIKARRFVPGEPEKASETAPTMQPTIKRGSKGTAVKTLQNLLIVLGYNLGKYGADGDFGADTEKALKLYQKDMRLTVDGICGPATWAHITAQKPISPPEKVPETSEGTEPAEAEESEPVEPEKDTNQYVRVTGNTVYVRAQPNTNGEIVSIAQIGDVLAYAGATSADGWHNVVCEGRSAWISGKYAELKAIPGEELPGTVAPDDGRAIIDISAYQTIKDATAAAKMAKHVKLVIHRASVGTAKDTKWAKHAKQLQAAGIAFGAYHYVKAKTVAAAKVEAQFFFEQASPFKPVFYVADMEYSGIPSSKARSVCSAFLSELRRLGARKTGIYVGHHLYMSWNLNYSDADFVWIPRYGDSKTNQQGKPGKWPAYPCTLHQYTSCGAIPGVTGRVDMNRMAGKGLTFHELVK